MSGYVADATPDAAGLQPGVKDFFEAVARG
jgi:hypothetical protein